jgi:hypothetical protein
MQGAGRLGKAPGHPGAAIVFMLYAVLVGLAIGLLVGGRPANLGRVRLRWGGVALAGLAIQLLLFSPPVTERVGDLGPPIYIGSTLMVLAFVLRNVADLPGLAVVALGAASNMAAILANGGFMPASPDALALAGKVGPGGYSNSVELASPALQPLVDIFAMPRWLPFANVFSVGDVFIGLGVALVIVRGMRMQATAAPGPPGP